jgi:PhoPQ-activated pathogenicity-related protein
MFPAVPALADRAEETALDRYVKAEDPAHGYRPLKTVAAKGYTAHVLEMVSQRWRRASEVDQPVWSHRLTIVEPHEIKTTIAALIIGGGANTDPVPGRINPLLVLLAQKTNSVVAEIGMVPNQPLTFTDETGGLGEDELVAYSWDKYLRTGDETWPLRLPMTKSVVRAMDTVEAFCASPAGGGIVVDRFVVGGASKRGWTAWLTAAVDRRVAGIVPVVIDVLNVGRCAVHEYRTYGFWPPALRPYEARGIMEWIGRPELDALMKIEDPYSYRTRYTMPKLILNATGDQFFVPDASQYYFDDLPDGKYLRYLPNTDHSLKGVGWDAAHTVLAFYHSIIDDAARPDFSWRFENDGTMCVRTRIRPTAAKLWHAVNPKARDFRLETIGKAFRSVDLHTAGDGTYIVSPVRPTTGWAAYFVELTYPSPYGDRFKVTTGVRIVPDDLPFPPPD